MDKDADFIKEIGIGAARSVAMIDHNIDSVIIHDLNGSGGKGAGTTRNEDAVAGRVTTGDKIVGINVIGGLYRICGGRGTIRQFDEERGLSDDGP